MELVHEVQRRLLGTEYLRSGNHRQRLAAETLEELNLETVPNIEEWALAGTIPLDVGLPESDLDILVCAAEPEAVRDELTARFSHMPEFTVWAHRREAEAWCLAFSTVAYPIEFFIQSKPLREQRAFRHLVAEYALLTRYGKDLGEQVRQLKASGMETEPAFAEALGLSGDPYLALLQLEPCNCAEPSRPPSR
ncbi:DUF4269 domain-containing protein [Nesterenkonia ebinurensis]|uniref:DUF4269 domain-containing protein n=1 Tax=Nesterenkonia ebinurensis TaxID=2608252 RepID=UPI00123D812A|nr:DUF4269 domain-containing protein [Nesterenkonia ebinurensis]